MPPMAVTPIVPAVPEPLHHVELPAKPPRAAASKRPASKTIVQTPLPPGTVAAPATREADAVVARAKDVPPPWAKPLAEDDRIDVLRRLPELSLIEGIVSWEAWGDLDRRVREDKERFIDNVISARGDLATLPFRKGAACKLDQPTAANLGRSSRAIRRLLGSSPVRLAATRNAAAESEAWAFSSYHVQSLLTKEPAVADPSALPAVEQVLAGEAAPARQGMVQYLRGRSYATAALARRAVFDPAEVIRRDAIEALRGKAADDYLPVLVAGFRHPWPRINQNAADAVVGLNVAAAVPALVRELDATDPAAPFEAEKDGERFRAVREMVRLNHHANCLLCHAPSFASSDPVRGPVPSPLEPLPVLQQYYGDRLPSRGLVVRADVTYLRQDFSEVLPVDTPGPWPKEQRFDFLVRTRRLADGEGIPATCGPAVPAANHVAAAYALRQLTGLDGGYSAAGWQAVLADRTPTSK
jgi:hypothetical protein